MPCKVDRPTTWMVTCKQPLNGELLEQAAGILKTLNEGYNVVYDPTRFEIRALNGSIVSMTCYAPPPPAVPLSARQYDFEGE
jgi:hypothetical protein